MALRLTLVLALALSTIHLSASTHLLHGKVSCLDCDRHYDFSGIKVVVKCDKVKKLAMATSEEDGSFKTELPSDAPNSPPLNCLSKLLGGPNQLYATRKNMASNVKLLSAAPHSNSYTISTALAFSTACPSALKINAKCGAPNKNNNNIGSSKTYDLPLPPEWGLAPSSYYIPFFPIIGIP